MRLTRARILLVVTSTALGVLLGATPALAYDLFFWYGGAQQKIYPATARPTVYGRANRADQVGSLGPMSLTAARGEFEGRQLVLKPYGNIQDVWIEPSDLRLVDGTATIPAASVSTYRVHYVYIRTPSSGRTRRGYEPDPLLPMTLANGQRLGWQPNGAAPTTKFRSIGGGRTQPFYVLFRAPDAAPAGVYRGTLTLTAQGADGSALPTVTIPVQFRVHKFSITRRTIKTSVGISLRSAQYWNSADHRWLPKQASVPPTANRIAERTDFKGDQLNGWFRYFSDHRISPWTTWPAWETGSDSRPPIDNGEMRMRDDYMNDYLGSGEATTFEGRQYGFTTVRMPEYELRTPYITNPFASATYRWQAARYYSTMKRELGPWSSKAFVYAIDEPVRSKRTFVERYAALSHLYAPGVPFLVTIDPVNFDYRLIKGVDIYVHKMHFFYRDKARWIAKIRRAGKKVWVYTHSGRMQSQTPNYLIDKPFTDVRAHGWFVYHTGADGFLYYSVDRWVYGLRLSSIPRDPYVDTISMRSQLSPVHYSNGDGSLVYPGYYPRLGLVLEGAPPVGSLRMEALRDGLEDYEYLKLVRAKGGSAKANTFVARIIGAPKTVVSSGKATFPAYPWTLSSYNSARTAMAIYLGY